LSGFSPDPLETQEQNKKGRLMLSENGILRLSKDWKVFAIKLSGVLSKMVEDQMLVISDKHSKRFIQFAAQGGFGLRAEISSNAYLSESDRLTGIQIAQLIQAGWGAPTGKPGESTPESDPDGSPNFFIDFPAPIETARIATQAVTALSEILRIPHPGFLQYEAFDTDGKTLVFSRLGIKRMEKEEQNNLGSIARRLLDALREITNLKDLDFDKDGDVSLRYGSISMFVSVIGNPPWIRFYAQLVQGVRETHKLHARLNELNSDIGFMHFFVRDKTIYAISEITASHFQYAVLAKTMQNFSKIADGINEMLQDEFGRKMTRPTHAKSVMIH
jgi:hypothetical protein